MTELLDGMLTAFSMYTVLPTPPSGWDRGGLRYALCFLPTVGLTLMALSLSWQYLAVTLGVVPGLFAAAATLLPVAFSGGIHMDGLMDSADALASHASPQKKLDILSDPRVGAFGALACAAYLLLSFGLWLQAFGSPRLMLIPAAGHVLSRALSGLSMVRLPCAKTSGLAYLFSGGADRRAVSLVCLGFLAACAAFLAWTDLLWGGLAFGAAILCFLRHRRICLDRFGGNTGDLSGFLLQKIELLALLAAAIGGVFS